MENTKQIQNILREMGIKGQFKPYREAETGAILLHVRRPAKIVDGLLVGEVIDLYSHTPPIFRVWTAHTRKAKACAARYGLRISLVDGECYLFIPAHLADTLLREFGAKVKSNRKPSPQAIEALRQYHGNKRLAG
jgi:hypothetical protein